MKQSPSSIGTFKTCPRQYEAKYITKEVVFTATEASLYGDRMHKAFENGIKDGTPLPEEFAHLQVLLDAAKGVPGVQSVEGYYGVTTQGKPAPYKSAAIRCKVDFVSIDGDRGFVFDWKTGKPKKDFLQLKVNAVCLFAANPNIKTVKVGFVYTKTGDIDSGTYKREAFDELLAELNHDIEAIFAAESLGVFTPTPNGLCKSWCDVKRCEFHGRGSRANA